MKILITGAKGQLGEALQPINSQNVVLPFDHAGLDIADSKRVAEVVSSEKPDVVINAAAYNDVDKAESEPEKAMAVNAHGPENLAVACEKLSIPFVHVSTDYVFDGEKKAPYHELDEVNPLSSYARSKWAGEVAVRKAHPYHFIVRTAWVFHTKGENFFTKLIRLAKKGPLKIVDDQFASPTYAPHLAQGIMKLLDSHCYGTYHLAGQGSASRYEEFKHFLDLSSLPIKISPVSNENFKQVARRPKNTTLITLQVPRIILPPWEQGVEEFVKEFQP